MRHLTKQLNNGLRIVTVPMPDTPTVTVLVLVQAGSNYEPAEVNGISHFLEHMCFKGTTNRPEPSMINRELDALGAQTNAFTGNEYTGYWSKGQVKHFPKLLDVIADVYLNSTLPETELEKERGVILDEMNMYEDMPMRKVYEVFEHLLYGDQPAGRTILGQKEVIKTVSREAFLDYRAKHYVANGTTVVVAGDVTHKDVVREVSKLFAEISTDKKHTKKKTKDMHVDGAAIKQTKPALAIEDKKTDQSHIVVGFRTVGNNHKDHMVLNLASTILGQGMSSRLFERLREQMGVGYYVRSGQDSYTDHGFLTARTGVVPSRAGEVVMAILEEFQRLVAEEVEVGELKKAKEYFLGNMMLALESSDELAEFFGFQYVLEQEIMSPKKIAKTIKAITAKDINRIAKKYFTAERLNVAVVGPKAKMEDIAATLRAYK